MTTTWNDHKTIPPFGIILSLFFNFLLLPGAGAQGPCAFLTESVRLSSPHVPNDFKHEYGYALDIVGDVAVVSAPQGLEGTLPGEAYVYRFNSGDGIWGLEATLSPSDGATNDRFGHSLAACETVIVVCSLFDDDNGTNSGSAYVFRYNGTTQSWDEEAKLLPADGEINDQFGNASAISRDGVTIIIGASRDNNPSGGVDAGAAYLFQYDGTSWSQQSKLTPANPGISADFFGGSVAIDGVTSTVIVGAPNHIEIGPPIVSGTAYVFDISDPGNPVEIAKLTAPDAFINAQLGFSVSIDGSAALVGAPMDQHSGVADAGSAYVFRNGPSGWVEESKLTAGTNILLNSRYGSAVALEGNTAVVSQPAGSTDGMNVGRVFVHHFDGAGWPLGLQLGAENIGASQAERFGLSIALSSGTLHIGEWDTDYAQFSGHTYFYPGLNDCNANGIPDTCEVMPCPADITPSGYSNPCGNGVVNIDDLVTLLTTFGPCPPDPAPCHADIEPQGPPAGNGVVNIDDLVAVLNNFGPCGGNPSPATMLTGLEISTVTFDSGFPDAAGVIDANSVALVSAAWAANQNGANSVDVYRLWVPLPDWPNGGTISFAGGSVAGGVGGTAEPLVLSAGKNATFFVPSGSYDPVNVGILAIDGGSGFEWFQTQAFGTFIAMGTATGSGPMKLGDTAALWGILTGAVNEANTGWGVVGSVSSQYVVSDGNGGWRILIGQFAVPQGKTFTAAVRLVGDGVDTYATTSSLMSGP